jgi:hypothetical protein
MSIYEWKSGKIWKQLAEILKYLYFGQICFLTKVRMILLIIFQLAINNPTFPFIFIIQAKIWVFTENMTIKS